MKKYTVFAMALVLVFTLLTGCGCSNSKPANTNPSTLPSTTGATIMPTTEATTMPTTMATTAPTTEAPTTNATDATDNTENDANGTESPTDATVNNEARNRTPMPNTK